MTTINARTKATEGLYMDYKAWYCGHWHINKRIDKMHFLMHEVESF